MDGCQIVAPKAALIHQGFTRTLATPRGAMTIITAVPLL